MLEAVRCPKCSTSIATSSTESWCTKCGEALPSEIQEQMPALVALRARITIETHNLKPQAPIQTSSVSPGLVFAIISLFLLGWGVIRWNSVDSQIVRGVGGQDGLAVSLFIGGALLMIGAVVSGVTSSPPATPTPVSESPAQLSTEDRLRRLQDLHAKSLISDTEFAERKSDILGSI